GTVTIDSEIGKGTVVHIYLPRTRPRFARRTAPAVPDQNAEAGPASRILVVDDNGEVRTAVSTMIRDFGHEVTEAASGQTALQLLDRSCDFDLLVIDLAMPVMNGAELAERARLRCPGVPMLFVTGDAEAR